MRVLLLINEPILTRTLEGCLLKAGYEPDTTKDVEIIRDYIKENLYDVLIVDADLSWCHIADAIRKLRKSRIVTPIIVLFSSNRSNAPTEFISAGADYCVAKPINYDELLIIIKALIRRQAFFNNTLEFGNTHLNLDNCVLSVTGKNVSLTKKEFELAKLLFQYNERIISKEKILNYVWGYDTDADYNNVEVYIGFLRKKLSKLDSNVHIVTKRNMGYYLEMK